MENNKKTLTAFAPDLLALFRIPIDAHRQNSPSYLAILPTLASPIVSYKPLALLWRLNLYHNVCNNFYRGLYNCIK
jgi:hypothetical protein